MVAVINLRLTRFHLKNPSTLDYVRFSILRLTKAVCELKYIVTPFCDLT